MKFFFSLFSIIFFLTGCVEPKSEPIQWGHENCHSCKMTLTDKRFGGELVTKKGKVYKFDALECMLNYQDKNPNDYKVYVVDHSQNGALIEAEKAIFTYREDLRSPMGKGILAAEIQERFEKTEKQSFLKWNDVKKLLE